MSSVWGVSVGKFYLLRSTSSRSTIVSDSEHSISRSYVNAFWHINRDNEFNNIWKSYTKRIKKKTLLEISRSPKESNMIGFAIKKNQQINKVFRKTVVLVI